MLEILTSIYFSLFIIFVKQLQCKQIRFTILMIVQYILLLSIFNYTIWFYVLYTFMTFVLLKILYKDKSHITDVFIFTIANVSTLFINVYWRIILIILLFIFRKYLYNIQKLYYTLWNSTLTFRTINIILFNIIFYIIGIIT